MYMYLTNQVYKTNFGGETPAGNIMDVPTSGNMK